MEISSKDRFLERLRGEVIASIITVHRSLGPGFLESVYQLAMMHELNQRGMKAESEKEVVVYYDGVAVGKHRLDILVEDEVIVELKTVEQLGPVHYAQVRSYLKATDLEEAILVNMASPKADFRRVKSVRNGSTSIRDLVRLRVVKEEGES